VAAALAALDSANLAGEVRRSLAESRRRGEGFDDAWREALERLAPDDDSRPNSPPDREAAVRREAAAWREALRWARSAFEAAYVGSPQGRAEEAAASLEGIAA
jgi:hypothetical protein